MRNENLFTLKLFENPVLSTFLPENLENLPPLYNLVEGTLIDNNFFPKGSEIITPILTYSTTVTAIVKNNLVPSFVDVDLNTLCIDTTKIEKSITKNTKAILGINLMGNIADWIKIKKIAKKHNLTVIEDSADTIGAKINNRSTGFYTDASMTSFYGSHVINGAGNGGMASVN